MMRRGRTLGVCLAIGALMFGAACGREGGPGEGATEQLEFPVAENVSLPDSPTLATMQQRGRIVMGIKNDQPGLGLESPPASGQYTGFDVEMGRMVAAGLGFGPDQIDYVVVPSAAREDAISRGDVDYYVGTYTINDNRKQRVGFAGPYFLAGQDLLVRADDDTITGPTTLQDKRVCSVTGSTPIQRVREENLTSNVVEFQNYSQCVDQLLANQVDAVTTDDAILSGYAAEDPGTMRVVGEVFSEEPYGIGVPRDDVALRNRVNDLLEQSVADGTWQRVYDATLGQSGTPATPPAVERY